MKNAVTYSLVVTEEGHLIHTLINKQHNSNQTFKEILRVWNFEINKCIIYEGFSKNLTPIGKNVLKSFY